MINRSFFLLTFLLLASPVQASMVDIPHNEFTSNTHTHTPIELKPASLDNSYKVASVCFLGVGDCPQGGFDKGDEDYSKDTEIQCKNEGFTKQNCNSVQIIDQICPYNSNYGKGCKCSPNLVTCSAGQVGIGDSCDGKYVSCGCATDLKTCASNEVGIGTSCGGKYESCTCKPEYQYNSSNCITPRSTSGASCGGKYTECSCPASVSSGNYGCAEYYPAPCTSVCKKAKTDNCDNRTAVSIPYGCMSYWADCPDKCEKAYPDNCRNRDAVAAPNGCQTYWADCASKCQVAVTASCETDIKTALPNAVLVKTIGDVSSYGMSGKQIVLMNNISDPTVSLYIGNGTTIFSANTTGSSRCSKTTLSADIIQLTGNANINADISAKELSFGAATITANGNLTGDIINVNSGNNFIKGAGASLTTTGNLNIKSGSLAFGTATLNARTLKADIITLSPGTNLLISGDSNVNDRVEVNNTASLNISGGTHYINVMRFIKGSSSTKTTVNITNARVYMNKGKQASSSPYYNDVIAAGGWNGKPFEMILASSTTLDMGAGALTYSEPDSGYGNFIITLKSSSKIVNMGGLTCRGGQGLQFVLAAGSNSSVQMLGKTSTCSGTETTIRAKDASKEAYVKLDHEAKDIMVYSCMFYKSGDGYSYLCERYAACNNINGVTDSCEYSMTKEPDYTSCQSCKRNNTTYYGGKCTVNCDAIYNQAERQCYDECNQDSSSVCYLNCYQQAWNELLACGQNQS